MRSLPILIAGSVGSLGVAVSAAVIRFLFVREEDPDGVDEKDPETPVLKEVHDLKKVDDKLDSDSAAQPHGKDLFPSQQVKGVSPTSGTTVGGKVVTEFVPVFTRPEDKKNDATEPAAKGFTKDLDPNTKSKPNDTPEKTSGAVDSAAVASTVARTARTVSSTKSSSAPKLTGTTNVIPTSRSLSAKTDAAKRPVPVKPQSDIKELVGSPPPIESEGSPRSQGSSARSHTSSVDSAPLIVNPVATKAVTGSVTAKPLSATQLVDNGTTGSPLPTKPITTAKGSVSPKLAQTPAKDALGKTSTLVPDDEDTITAAKPANASKPKPSVPSTNQTKAPVQQSVEESSKQVLFAGGDKVSSANLKSQTANSKSEKKTKEGEATLPKPKKKRSNTSNSSSSSSSSSSSEKERQERRRSRWKSDHDSMFFRMRRGSKTDKTEGEGEGNSPSPKRFRLSQLKIVRAIRGQLGRE